MASVSKINGTKFAQITKKNSWLTSKSLTTNHTSHFQVQISWSSQKEITENEQPKLDYVTGYWRNWLWWFFIFILLNVKELWIENTTEKKKKSYKWRDKQGKQMELMVNDTSRCLQQSITTLVHTIRCHQTIPL